MRANQQIIDALRDAGLSKGRIHAGRKPGQRVVRLQGIDRPIGDIPTMERAAEAITSTGHTVRSWAAGVESPLDDFIGGTIHVEIADAQLG